MQSRKPYVDESPDIDYARARHLAEIQREKRRPASTWRKVLENRPAGYRRVDVTTGEVIEVR